MRRSVKMIIVALTTVHLLSAHSKAEAPTHSGLSLQAYDNYDLTGSDLRKLTDVDLKICSAACLSDNQCQAFSFNKWSHQCSLRGTIVSVRFEPSSIAGVYGSLPPVTDAPWEMVRIPYHGFNSEADRFQIASSFEQCELACQNEQSCVGLSYLYEQKTCKLFQAIGEYSPDEQSDSGIKHQRALGLATKFHPTFSGELQPVESSAYIVIHGTMSWDAPSKEAAALFALSQNQEVHALGSFNKDWIKIATADGNEGFALAEDLLTPKQFATRQDLIAKRDSALEYFERARHSWGPLAGATGVYPHFSGGCIEAVDLANGLHLLVNLAISTRWLQWSERESFYRVNLLNTTPVRWQVTAKVDRVEVRDTSVPIRVPKGKEINPETGSVQFYRIDGSGPDANFIQIVGFRNTKFYFKDAKTGKVGILTSQCGSLEEERTKVERLWNVWIEEYVPSVK